MRGRPAHSRPPGNHPALRRHVQVRGRKPPRVLLWSICSVTCLLFMGAAAMVAVGYLNPYGSIGLSILGVGSALYFMTVLFLVMCCLWVQRKYPGVYVMSIKLPSRRPRSKTGFINPNTSGYAPPMPPDTRYTIQNDLPPYTINMPGKKVTFPSAPEEPQRLSEDDQDADTNTDMPPSTPGNLQDEKGREPILPGGKGAELIGQEKTDPKGILKPYGDIKSKLSSTDIIKEKSTADQERKVHRKTHHIEVPFEEFPPSSSSKSDFNNTKEPSTDRQMDKITSTPRTAGNHPILDKGSHFPQTKAAAGLLLDNAHEYDSSATKQDTGNSAAISEKHAAFIKYRKHANNPNKDFSTTPIVLSKPEQDLSSTRKSKSPQVDENHTEHSSVKKNLLQEHRKQNSLEESGSKAHKTPVDNKSIANKPQGNRSNSNDRGHHSNSSNRGEKELHQKCDLNEKREPSTVSVMTSPNVTRKNNEDHSPNTSIQRAHLVQDSGKSTASFSHAKWLESSKRSITDRKYKESSHSNQTDLSPSCSINSGHSHRHRSLTNEFVFSSKSSASKKHQNFHHRSLSESTRGYSSDPESSDTRRHHYKIQARLSDGLQASSHLTEPSTTASPGSKKMSKKGSKAIPRVYDNKAYCS